MKVGEISEPFVSKSEAREEYKIIKVKAFYPQHKANLEDDWQIFEMLLKNEKQMDKLEKWIKEKQAIPISISMIHIKIPSSVTTVG